MGPTGLPEKVLLKQKFKITLSSWVSNAWLSIREQFMRTHEDKVILNFCFSKTFSGNPVGPIRRVPDPFGVHLVGVLMSPHELFSYR